MNKLPIKNVLKVLFDIKPVDKMGRVDIARIYNVQPVVNLGNQKPAKNAGFGGHTRIRGSGSSTINSTSQTKNPTNREALSGINLVRFGLSPVDYNHTPPVFKVKSVVDNHYSVEVRGIEPPGHRVTIRYPRQTTPTVLSAYQEKLVSQDELEKLLNSKINIKKELKSVGARVEKSSPDAKPRYRPIFAKQKSAFPNYPITQLPIADNYQPILSQINQKALPETDDWFVGEPREIYPLELTTAPEDGQASDSCRTSDVKPSPYFARGFERAQPEIESWVKYVNNQEPTTNNQSIFNFQILKLSKPDFAFIVADFKKTSEFVKELVNSIFSRKQLLAVGVMGFFVLVFISFGQYGISLKNEVMKESNLAVENLERANESLRVFDFESASDNFAEAYGEFSKAGESLNFMGVSITSLFAELPGAGKLKSAKNLVEAGKLLAEAGKSMSEAMSSLSETGSVLKLTIPDVSAISDVQNVFGDLKKSLISSSKNLLKVSALLSDISPDDLPEDKRESFLEFQSKLPELEGIVSDAVEYTSFLENLFGSNGVKKYLILFQNDSELRPTGGFPGTYAVVTFKDGRLDGFLVDDVYNLDGQLKENIIPPKPLQHITPNWGMRDANWFIDFSASAQKTMEFFKKEAGYEVDGVITMSPRMISDILKVVGPIEMPEYGFAVSNENFLSTIQAEVEYGDNREQPKKVVIDMAPKLLERINSSDTGKWLDIFNVFISGLDKKDILMYFKDLSLESFVAEKGFGGLVEKTSGDYLMVTLTNVKGSKTDRVTDNAIKVSVRFEEGRIIHKLELTRQHNGGSTRYGFYNKQNPTYVRVLVPEGSELLSISGNSDPRHKPLINYSDSDLPAQVGFGQDANLFKLESGSNFDSENGVSTYNESGKTGFAFWLITDPGKQKTVQLEYLVPFNDTDYNNRQGFNDYGIYIQKQPGLEVDNFEFQVGDALLYNGDFDKDLELTFTLSQ
ncbi:MAG: DUF4012 domain-containing protein [Candidatus Yanofskybacteria bacterium]|nr:DUF4012 domain-containing protein [Candidatus Yanofskybacteria bacterium]